MGTEFTDQTADGRIYWTSCRVSTLALKSKADITRSPKQEYERPHKTDWCLPIFDIKLAALVQSAYLTQLVESVVL